MQTHQASSSSAFIEDVVLQGSGSGPLAGSFPATNAAASSKPQPQGMAGAIQRSRFCINNQRA
eukprot:1160465-Pelagomonas_calceolata.AAC.8